MYQLIHQNTPILQSDIEGLMKTELRLITTEKYAEEKSFASKVIGHWRFIRGEIVKNNFSTNQISCPMTLKDYASAIKAMNNGWSIYHAASILSARIISREYGELKTRIILSEHFKAVDIKKE